MVEVTVLFAEELLLDDESAFAGGASTPEDGV
jgi:hypothetical protein